MFPLYGLTIVVGVGTATRSGTVSITRIVAGVHTRIFTGLWLFIVVNRYGNRYRNWDRHECRFPALLCQIDVLTTGLVWPATIDVVASC
jgi:hypothetical protein